MKEKKKKKSGRNWFAVVLVNLLLVQEVLNRHKKYCQLNSCKNDLALPVEYLEIPANIKINDDFKHHILGKLRDNAVGKICRKDKTILKIGMIFYGQVKRKFDKRVQLRNTVRLEMRRLGHLYSIFCRDEANITQVHNNAADMFCRQNFKHLREAINIYSTSTSGNMKPGLKQNLLYLIKRSVKALKATLLAENKDKDADELDKFLQIFKLWEDYIFGDAQYELNKRRQINLRKPDKLPLEDDVKLVRGHVITTMQTLCSDVYKVWDKKEFVILRDCACTRLTLLNARRGGEPARMAINEWEEAKADKWVDNQRIDNLDQVDKLLVKTLKVAYMTGKGNNHLVPLIIPEDVNPALEVLSNVEIRTQAGVNNDKNYLFPSTRQSDDHVSGWHSFHRVCEEVPLKESSTMKSTSNRHRISTMFATMDLPEYDRKLFYKHMGHGEGINENVYPTPLALAEITKVGKQLMVIDEG